MNTYTSQETKDFSFFTKNVYLDKKFLLLTPECPITTEMKNLLYRWDFDLIYSEGEQSEFVTVENNKSSSGYDALTQTKEHELTTKKLKEQEQNMEGIESSFSFFLRFIENIFENYREKQILDVRNISDTAKDLCSFVKENKQLILRLNMQKYNTSNNFLIMHSLRSTIYAIVIGLQLKMPTHKLIELATACMVHEIGMLKLPPKVYLTNEPLTPTTKKALMAHPVLSYNILKLASFPLSICVGVLEHHERENGNGYPRNLTKEKISLYGKIIAVACSYEATTAKRPYKEAKDAASGIVNMLKNENSQYDETILKALLFSLSFYPVGIFTHLSNGKIGQVVDINPEDPRFPIVQIYGEKSPTGDATVVRTSADGVKIKRPLTKDELKNIVRNKI